MIVYIPDLEEPYWLDPTSDSIKFPDLSFYYQDCWAFIINETGGMFKKTNEISANENLANTFMIFDFNKSDGHANIELSAKGAISENIKSVLLNLDEQQITDEYYKIINSYYSEIIFDTINISRKIIMPNIASGNFQDKHFFKRVMYSVFGTNLIITNKILNNIPIRNERTCEMPKGISNADMNNGINGGRR